MKGEGLPAFSGALGFLAAGLGGGSRHGPPVIQNAWNPADLLGVFGDAQQEIVILAAVPASFVQTAHGVQKPAFADDEVKEIIARQKKVRRPAGLEEGLVAAEVVADLVFIGIEQVGLRRRIDGLDHFVQSERRKLIVMIQKGEIV